MSRISEHEWKEAIAPKDGQPLGDPMREVDGKFFWWDETWTELYGPYDTEEEAKAALNEYARNL